MLGSFKKYTESKKSLKKRERKKACGTCYLAKNKRSTLSGIPKFEEELSDILSPQCHEMAVQMAWLKQKAWSFPGGSVVKNPPASLAWEIPWTEEPGRPQAMGSQRVRHNWVPGRTCKAERASEPKRYDQFSVSVNLFNKSWPSKCSQSHEKAHVDKAWPVFLVRSESAGWDRQTDVLVSCDVACCGVWKRNLLPGLKSR